MSTEADIVERIDAERTARTQDPLRPANPLLREAAAEITKLRAERDAAARAERERCAKVAETFFTPNILEHVGTKRAIAAEIRSLPDSAAPTDLVIATQEKTP